MSEASHLDAYDAARDELYGEEEDDPLLSDEGSNKNSFKPHLSSSTSTSSTSTTTKLVKPPLSTLSLLFLCFYSVGFGALWTFLLVVAIPQQVAKLDNVGDTKKGAALGMVMLFGGLISAIEPPLVGFVSDRTRTRWGRRKPFVFTGSILLVVTLSFLPHVRSLSSFILLYVLVQFFSNISSSANLAFLPDLVPKEQLGRASGMMGALGATGQLVGAMSGMLVTKMGMQGVYWMVSGLYLLTTAVTVCGVVDRDEEDEGFRHGRLQHGRGVAQEEKEKEEEETPAASFSQGLHTMYQTYTDAIIHNVDFRWVFLTRLLYNMGIYSVQEFLQYYVHDLLPLKNWSSTSEVSLLFVPLLCGGVISAYFAGRLSDQLGGVRKKFIYISGCVQTIVCLLLMLPNDSVLLAGVAALAFGVASGCYAAVDFAMVLDVLPNSKTIARDLGVWHVSLVLPQLLSTPLSGSLLDTMRKNVSVQAGYSSIFFLSGVWFLLSTVLVIKIRGVK